MIDDYSRDLLRSGIVELKAGNRESARRFLDRALYMSLDHDVKAEAWYWMSQLADNLAEKRRALENCLTHELRHARARRALAILDGKLNPDETDDPYALHAARVQGVIGAKAQRFMCPKCGGRMTYAPDGQSLVCDYCTHHKPLSGLRSPTRPLATTGSLRMPTTGTTRMSNTTPLRMPGTGPLRMPTTGPLGAPRADQKESLLGISNARAVGRQPTEQVFICQTCTAQFILPPGQPAAVCPHCRSTQVVAYDRSLDIITPEGLIPHAFDASRATAVLAQWLKNRNVVTMRESRSARRINLASPQDATVPLANGFYLPIWTFDLGGAIAYTGEITENPESGFPRVQHIIDSFPVTHSRLPIPASRKLSGPFVRLIPTFDLRAVQPYNPRYLAERPAELYDIPLDEALLDARSQGFALLKREMTTRLAPMRLLSASPAPLFVESFRLILLPVWMAEIAAGGAQHIILINGQTGEVRGDLDAKPPNSGSLLAWLSDLVNE